MQLFHARSSSKSLGESLRSSFRDWLPLFVMLLVALLLLILSGSGLLDIRSLPEKIGSKPILAAAVLLLLYIVKGLSGAILQAVLLVVSAMIFPLPMTILLNSVGTIIALTISWLTGRFTKPEKANALLRRNPKISRYLDLAREYAGTTCFLLHALGLHLEILGVLFGTLRLRYGTYLLTSFIAVFPSMLCFILLGHDPDPSSPYFWGCIGINIVMILASYLKTRALKRKKAKETA